MKYKLRSWNALIVAFAVGFTTWTSRHVTTSADPDPLSCKDYFSAEWAVGNRFVSGQGSQQKTRLSRGCSDTASDKRWGLAAALLPYAPLLKSIGQRIVIAKIILDLTSFLIARLNYVGSAVLTLVIKLIRIDMYL
jgi:hypothetical protein